jgi:hypothetical protein
MKFYDQTEEHFASFPSEIRVFMSAAFVALPHMLNIS